MKKTILFLYNKECSSLPPLLTIIDCLCDDYSLKIISYEKKGGIERLKRNYEGKDVEFLGTVEQEEVFSFSSRVCRRLLNLCHQPSPFFREATNTIDNTQYNLLWVIHESTANEFRDYLSTKKFVISFYELNDHKMSIWHNIIPVLQNAKEVIVPEYNRACILRVWLKLDKTPTVIPNKPLTHPRLKNIPNSYSAQLQGKKVILYQGYIQRSRNIDRVCEAVMDMPDYSVVLMGKGDESYIQELKNKFPQIIHIPFIAPPEHLYVTSCAHVAIVKYDFVVLNAIFCAPNKTWEYTGFDIPVLCHNIPGLEYTIGQSKAGVCTDLDNVDCIKNAIKEIDAHYDEYSHNARLFYESFDVKKALLDVVNKFLN